MDDRGLPRGVLAPDIDVREIGRGGGTMSVLEAGRAYDDMLARELGRLLSASGARFGNGPKERRLIPEVLSLGTWPLLYVLVDVLGLVGVVSSPPRTEEDVEEPAVRLRALMVTDDGIIPSLAADRGEARGGV